MHLALFLVIAINHRVSLMVFSYFIIYKTSVIIGLFYSRADRSPESAAHVHADQWRLDSLHRVWRQVHHLGDLKFKTE